MKKRLFILLIGLGFAAVNYAATPIHVSDPQNWSSSTLSSYVGKEVTFDVPMIVCSTYSGLKISPWRTMSATNQCIPGSSEYNTYRGNKGEMTLTGYPSVNYLRTGMRLQNLTVRVNSSTSVSYVSGTWSNYNTRNDLETNGYDERNIDKRGQHTLLVCAMNCEYYLTDYSQWVSNSGGNTSGQGPTDNTQHQAQRAKVSKALSKINADIYGLVEIQQGQGALAEIARDLTTQTGRNFTYIRDNSSASGTYTKSGYVYCSDVVEPVNALINNNTKVAERKKMQLFREKESGSLFYYSINHFKAKSGTGYGADADQGDGQSKFNATRVTEAQSVIADYNKYQSEDQDILIMGDLNAYGKEDPIRVFTDEGFVDLHRYFHADSSYSYTFRSEAGYLDHAIANRSMLRQITGMQAFHINSDEDDRYTYDKSNDQTMFRCSDHDPILVGLKLESSEMDAEVFLIDEQYTRIVDQFGREVPEGESLRPGMLYFQYEYGENAKGVKVRRVKKLLAM